MTECAFCGAWFVWPQPTAEAIAAHYDRNVSGMPEDLRAWRTDTTQDRWYEVVASRIARTAANANLRSATLVVDVGAGGMELTRRLADTFDHAEIEAWDLFADRADLPPSARRIDLNRLDAVPPPSASFDIVACVAVIEHILDPAALLRLLRSITAPGGFAYVAGPEVTSTAHRVLRRHWPYYCPDEHLTLPSLRSVEESVALAGGGRYVLRRMNVHYSLKYLLRFLRIPLPVPRSLDVVLPIPAGAFELIWYNDAVSGSASRETAALPA